MTHAEIVAWFAKRCKTATPEQIVFAQLGDVQSQLDYLVELRILKYGYRVVRDKPQPSYYLSLWCKYQYQKAA